MPSDVTPDMIVAEARTWLGVLWRHQGRTRAGIDCVGLLVCVARALGLSDYDSTGYGRHAQGQSFVRHFQANMDGIALAAARPGDVLVFVDADVADGAATVLGQDDVGLGDVGQRANHHVAAVVRLQFGRHGLEPRAEEHVHK